MYSIYFLTHQYAFINILKNKSKSSIKKISIKKFLDHFFWHFQYFINPKIPHIHSVY
jgi:hypothetical protein